MVSISLTRTSGLPIGACGLSKYRIADLPKAADSVVLQQMLQAILYEKCYIASPPPSYFCYRTAPIPIAEESTARHNS